VLPPLRSFDIRIVSFAMAVLLVASLAAVASAKSFLDARVGAGEVESTMLSQLAGMANVAQLLEIEEELRPMYVSLPKNKHGRLDPVTVRYALHRYFLQKHGWYVNGLGHVNSTEGAATGTTIMKDRAPAFIQSMFERRLQGQGLSHHDLAVFAATLTDLIHSEVSGNLERAYAALELSTVGPVSRGGYEMATKAYLLTYLSSGAEVVTETEELLSVERSFDYDYPAWNDTLMWASDLQSTIDDSDRRCLNPFVQHESTFEKQVSFLQELGHRLGTFQNLECRRLKDQLAEMEDIGTGRVPLTRFYRGILDGEFQFTESVEYLRHMGALDDTNPKRMSVVIPNYIQSQSNCLAGSSFYSVCCSDECEGLLGQVEREVQGPSAPPAQIIAVVSNMQSDTVHAPRNLSKALVSRLGEIAHLHGGSVPLHGRLFAQWMHHAYPLECRFPHVIGATNRISPDEWMEEMDIDSAQVEEEELLTLVRHEEQDKNTPRANKEALPWTLAEELVAGHLIEADASHSSAFLRSLRFALAALVLGSLAVPVVRHASAVSGSPKGNKLMQHVV